MARLPGARQPLDGYAKLAVVIAAFLVLAIVPLVDGNGFVVFMLTKALALSIWAVGLDLLVGYTGLTSFGHSAWLGLGAYAAGYVVREHTTDIFVALFAAAAVVAVVSGSLGLLAARVSGVAFAIVTLAIAASVYLVIVRLPPEFIGGRTGLFGVPAPSILGRPIAYGPQLYFATACLLVLVLLAVGHIVRTPFGRALQAVRDNETRARFIGIDVTAQRWAAFVLSAVIGGLGGAMLCFLQGGMSTMEFQWFRSSDVLVMVLLGGMGTLYGPVIGAIFFTVVFTSLASWAPREWQIYMGLMFLLVVLFLPEGFIGAARRLTHRAWP